MATRPAREQNDTKQTYWTIDVHIDVSREIKGNWLLRQAVDVLETPPIRGSKTITPKTIAEILSEPKIELEPMVIEYLNIHLRKPNASVTEKMATLCVEQGNKEVDRLLREGYSIAEGTAYSD